MAIREIMAMIRVESCFTNIFLALIKEYMQYTKGCQNLKEKAQYIPKNI